MTVTAYPSEDRSTLTIQVAGRFDFSSHQEFRKLYESAPVDVKQYVIDMTDATYLDSSALGMLLLLRDHAGGDNASIRIVNSNPDVKKILTISNFGQLFTLE